MAIETILVAVSDQDSDRIDRLSSAAIEIADPLEATVVVAHVFSDESETVPEGVLPIAGQHRPYVLSDAEYDEVIDDEMTVDDATTRHETVRKIVDRLKEAGVNHETRGAVGDPGDALITLVEEVDADRVIVGGRQRSPTDKMIFGSVAQDVLLSSPCPVTFVRDE